MWEYMKFIKDSGLNLVNNLLKNNHFRLDGHEKKLYTVISIQIFIFNNVRSVFHEQNLQLFSRSVNAS